MPEDGIFCPYCGTRQIREKKKALKRANGTGTVYKLQGRRKRPWIAAKNRVVIGYYETKTAALEALSRLTGQSHSTLSKHKQLITPMSAWALREELITTNFAQFVRIPENVKKEKEIFSEADIEKLEADGSDAAKIVLMLIYTGMRIGELFSLPLSGYHGNYVIGGEKTDAGRNRVIPIRPEGRVCFRYFAERTGGDLFISGYAGQRIPNNFRKRDYYPLLDRLGIQRKTPHATRHTYASRARQAGMPPEMLQKILGHADYSTTANNMYIQILMSSSKP